MTAIECIDVSKKFDKVTALEHMSFKLETGNIYALLGRNGAGKTTLLNCLCTRYLPNNGEIYVLGEKAYENEKVLSQICFMSDYMEVFSLKKVNYILKYASSFYKDWNTELMQRLLESFDIDSKVNYSTLSKGKQTAVSIIIGLCCGCEIVLFDEIYSGLDAVARQQFYDILLQEQEKNPRTFLLSTHLIEEMSGLFNHVLMIDKGRVILNEEMDKIHDKSYKCTGRTDSLKLLKDKNILSLKEAGTMTEYSIYDNLTQAERKELESKGFLLSALSLQELFIAFTVGDKRKWGDTNGTD